MSLKRNIIYNTVYQFYMLVIPLITAPYISRVLGAEAIGKYSYTYSIVNYFMLFTMLGVSNYGSKFIASIKNDKVKLSKEFINIYSMQLITGGISLFLYICFIILFEDIYFELFIAQAFFLLSAILDINWFYFGLEEFKLTVSRNILIKTISVLLVFIFVKSENDLLLYTLIMSIAMLLSQSFVWLFIRKYIFLSKPVWSDIKIHFKNNIILFIPVLSFSVYKLMDKIMIGSLVNMTSLGLYENASKLVSLPISFITAIGTVMLPRISNLISDGKSSDINYYIEKSFDLISFITIPITLGMMAISDNVAIIFFGTEFMGSGPLIFALAPTIIFIAWANIIRTQFLIPFEKNRIYIVSTIIAAVINLFFNFWFIPKYYALGAVIATIIAEFIVFLILFLGVSKDIPVIKYVTQTYRYFIFSVIMYALVRYLVYSMVVSITALFTQIIIGMLVYCSLNGAYSIIKKTRY